MRDTACSNAVSTTKRFIQKYFLEGQKLEEKQKAALETLPSDAPVMTRILVKHRRLIGILIPMLFFEILWWMLAFRHDFFSYFPSRYILSITMIFGATVAGMTSEGGGAVAFPVMTLALGRLRLHSQSELQRGC